MRDPISIPMRCAATGGRFHACFIWSPAQEKYVLFSMLPETLPGPGEPMPAVRPRASVVVPSAPTPGAGAGAARREPGTPPSLDDVQGSEVDFTGFHCPHCGYGKATPPGTYRFVRCGVCGDLVCASRTRREGPVEVFHCHERCGARSGLSGGGGIESYRARTISGGDERPGAARLAPASPQALSAPRPAELPGPRNPGLPGKRMG